MGNTTIFSIIPDPETLLEFEPEELAGYVMEYIIRLPDQEHEQLSCESIIYTLRETDWPSEYRNKISEYELKISKAIREAWVWLEREGFISRYPEAHGSYFVTRRGERVKNATDVDALRKADLLPRRLLHPIISLRIWSSFLRGEYDTAVFQAFKEVEIAVRNAGVFPPTDIGVNLMRKAFNQNGPLTDPNLPIPENEALANLFAGAIGSYKNPISHRSVSIAAEEAVEMIMLASYLLGIVDARQVSLSVESV